MTIDFLRSAVVGLSPAELSYDQIIANARMTDVRAHGRKNAADVVDGDDEWSNHLIGVHGEHAFAKWLERRPLRWKRPPCAVCGFYTGTVNTFKDGGDVGRYQVRTRRRPGAALIVRDGDRDDDIFVLVTADPAAYRQAEPQFTIVGWEYAKGCKRGEFRTDPRGRGAAYFVPQTELMSMMSLPRDV